MTVKIMETLQQMGNSIYDSDKIKTVKNTFQSTIDKVIKPLSLTSQIIDIWSKITLTDTTSHKH
jgi:hypothetical protein